MRKGDSFTAVAETLTLVDPITINLLDHSLDGMDVRVGDVITVDLHKVRSWVFDVTVIQRKDRTLTVQQVKETP
jgi:hypothetical protein